MTRFWVYQPYTPLKNLLFHYLSKQFSRCNGSVKSTLLISRFHSIVLVHGINGHYINTWKADDGTIWPVDLLSEQLPEVRVMTYGYRGTYNDTISVATSFDHGQSLLSLLIDKRKAAHEEVRPIIFVGHSLGGIIIKQVRQVAQ